MKRRRLLGRSIAILTSLILLGSAILWPLSHRHWLRWRAPIRFATLEFSTLEGRFAVYASGSPYADWEFDGCRDEAYQSPGSPGTLRYYPFRSAMHSRGGYWVLSLAYWVPMLASALGGGAWWFVSLRRDAGVALCRGCRYDLRATPDQCPECGWRSRSAESVSK